MDDIVGFRKVKINEKKSREGEECSEDIGKEEWELPEQGIIQYGTWKSLGRLR